MSYGNSYPPHGPTSPPQYPVAPQGAPKAGGYLYPNEKKQRAEQPDQKGKIKLGDDVIAAVMRGEREFYLSAWNKQDQKGQRFLSVNTKVIEAKPQGGYGGQQQWAPQPPPGSQGQWAPNPHAGTGGHAVAPPAPQYQHPGPPPGTSWNTPQHVPATGPGRPVQGGPQGGWDGGGDTIPFN